MIVFIKVSELTNPTFKRDPYPQLQKMIDAGPLVDCKIPLLGKLRLATTYSAVDQVLRDRNRFVLEAKNAGVGKWGDFIAWMPRPIRVLANNMLQKDEPDHRRLRRLSEQAFQRKNIASMRNDVAKISSDLIDSFASRKEIDLLEAFCREFPLAVICELLGLPPADRPKLMKWMSGLTNASFPMVLFTAIPGIMKTMRYFRKRFQIERESPGEGLISQLVMVEEDGDQLNEEELLAMVFILFAAGHETTTHLIALSMLTLLSRPDLKEQWLADPEIRGSAVDELLRYLSPVQLTKPRYCAQDTEIDGVKIARGERMMAVLACANVDNTKFDQPMTIDIGRDPNPHKGFGGGIHFCLGAQLARLETEIALTHLLERLPSLRLSCNEDQLKWTRRPGIRSLAALPCNLG